MDHGPRLSEAFTPRKQKRSACRSISFWTWWATGSRNAAKDQNIFGESESGVAGIQELKGAEAWLGPQINLNAEFETTDYTEGTD
jgi:hypothetical protein